MIDPDRVMELLKIAFEGGSVEFEGVVQRALLNPAALDPYRGEIVEMLNQLPDEFMDNGGGGWTFLNLCTLKGGAPWTDLHRDCEALIFLALALELASWVMSREMWDALPGGMPYVTFKRSAFEKAAFH